MNKRKKYKTMRNVSVQVRGKHKKRSIKHKKGMRGKGRNLVICYHWVFLPLLIRQGHHQERGGDIFSIIAFLLQIKSFAMWPNWPCTLN